ncbi:hypothetical protein IV203_022501 [Nitzschia inconspicua]|uniref:Uncharacterized protein n=1 Tax=Nitzschia inconspicua TaxID=303405 RepID=A0A9K3KKJ2_9STRA|nr:hypothetical protein IV203_022501 [Nitzschia inconspicua]
MLVRKSFFYVAACSSIAFIGSAIAQIQVPHHIRGGDVLMQKDTNALPPHRFLQAGKQTICHIPPGDPANFNTITVGEPSLSAHLAKGSLVGRCSLHCTKLCDDDISCTVDECDVDEKCIPSENRAITCGGKEPFCSFELNTCVECLEPSHCGDDSGCTTYTCNAGQCGTVDNCSSCSSDADCGKFPEKCGSSNVFVSRGVGSDSLRLLLFFIKSLAIIIMLPLKTDDGIACTDDTCKDGKCKRKPNDDKCPDNQNCVPGQGGCFAPPGLN